MTFAAYSGNLDIIAMLLQHSTLEQYCKTTFIPPICAATIAGHERVVQWFCDTYTNNDPKPDQLPKTIEGKFAMSKKLSLWFIPTTASVQSVFSGVTPLMMAVIYDQPQIYMDLLQKFTNSHQLTNALNLTASDYKQYF